MNKTTACLGILAAVNLMIAPLVVQANVIVGTPTTKKQSFKLNPNKKSFIDFGKLGNKLKSTSKSTTKFGKVKLKPMDAKKAAAKFNFGVPTQTAGQGHEVSVELVSLSLVSVSPVSLDPFLGKGSGARGNIHLGLSTAAVADPPGKAKFAKNKKKGELKFDLSKSLKVSKLDKVGNKKKSKALSGLKLSATNVPFAQNSPITVTAPFCLENGSNASLCLAPMSESAVPEPQTYALLAFGLGLFVFTAVIHRRRLSQAAV